MRFFHKYWLKKCTIVKKIAQKCIFCARFEHKSESKTVKAGRKNKIELTHKEKHVPKQSDRILVEAAVNGDADSFTELCQRYYPAMVAIAHSILGDSHLAEDAAQQSFAKAVRRLPQLKNKDKFVGWLAAICRNAAIDLARQQKQLRYAEDKPITAKDSQQDGTIEAVKKAISRLSRAHRELIFLRYYEGMTYERMSAVLGISEQAINGRLRRAKKKIAQYLKQNGFSEVKL